MPHTPAAPAPKDESTETETSATGKGRPTPSRAEREAARKRPLVPNDRRAASKERRERLNAQRERARIGMANGEERFLPLRDKGPQKKFVRDYVDARFSPGEIMLPLVALFLVISFIPYAGVAEYGILAVWAFFFLVIIDSVLMGARLKKRLGEKFGESKVEKGYRWYAAMRALQMRPLRLPKPQVKRGDEVK